MEVVGGEVDCLLLGDLELVPRMVFECLSRIDGGQGRGGDEEPGLQLPGLLAVMRTIRLPLWDLNIVRIGSLQSCIVGRLVEDCRDTSKHDRLWMS